MMGWKALFLMSASIIGVVSNQSELENDSIDLYNHNGSITGMPGGIFKELASLLTIGVVHYIFDCPQHTIPSDSVAYYLYTRDNPNDGLELTSTNLKSVDTNKILKIIIHGWVCSYKTYKIVDLKDAYLKRYDCNVILVDWSKLSMNYYTKSYCDVPPISKTVGTFLCDLNNYGAYISKMHVLGHSMGGQIAGLAGQEVKKQCGQTIGRITGLDPAGPLYQDTSKFRRLDKTDAKFVDVIHTNMGFLGYYDVCGSVDFFPNCGSFQPSCPVHDGSSKNFVQTQFDTMNCNHIRSVDYMVESINPSNYTFIGQECTFCPGVPYLDICPADLSQYTEVMGEFCSMNPPAPKFKLKTNSQRPYALG